MHFKSACALFIRRLGGLRCELLVRGFGMMLCLAALGRLGNKSLVNFLQAEPISMIALGLCGYLLLIGGFRVIVLLATACAGWRFIYQVLDGNLGRGLAMQAAEYPLFPVVPTVCLFIFCLAYGLERATGSEPLSNGRLDSLVVTVFRWLALTTLFFVSFHKCNLDFLTGSMSCEEVLKPDLSRTWTGWLLPLLATFSHPWTVVAMEGPVPICLLIFARRIGIIVVCVFFSAVSLVKAIVVTLAVIVPALAFLPASDMPVIRRYWRHMGIVWSVLTPLVLIVSHSHYQGTRPWYLHGVHHAMVVAILVIVGGCQCVAWFGSESNGQGFWSRIAKGFGPRPTLLGDWFPGQVLVGSFAGVCFLNGLSPYLGLKFEYSFAMLSNLRVDDARWNHLIMPRWVRLTACDPFVHLTRFEFVPISGVKFTARTDEELHPALYSPWVVADRLQLLSHRNPRTPIYMELEYKGDRFEFAGDVGDETLRKFVKKLPAKNRWFQNELAIFGPQPCVH